MRTYVLGIYVTALMGLGYWLGEEGKFPLRAEVLTAALLPFVLALTLRSKRWPHKAVIASVGISSYAIAVFGGVQSFRSAYNECIEQGERIRTRLGNFATEHERYPATLEEIAEPLPCSRRLHSSLLRYESTTQGYTLSFEDWLMRSVATESMPFHEGK